jgi:tetratricopeptide (TPR) repeat protein
MSTTIGIALLVWVLGAGQGFAQQAAPGPRGRKAQLKTAIRMLERGRYGPAIKQSREIISKRPNHAGARAVMGIALVRSGRMSDALPQFELSQGSMVYTQLGGYGAHADALRAAGFGGEAWALRSQQLGGDQPRLMQVKVYCHGIDDLLSIGDVGEALALGETVVSIAPNAPAAHAFYSTALLWNGDVESAEFHDWLSRISSSTRVSRVPINQAWLGEVVGDVVAGQRAWGRAKLMRKKEPRIAAWEAGWWRRQGNPEMGWTVADAGRFSSHQSSDLLAERVLLLRMLGRDEDANQELERFGLLFPAHPVLHELETVVNRE